MLTFVSHTARGRVIALVVIEGLRDIRHQSAPGACFSARREARFRMEYLFGARNDPLIYLFLKCADSTRQFYPRVYPGGTRSC